MRKIVLHAFGGPEVLVVRDEPDPEPERNGYVVEVRAAALNFADVVTRRGEYGRDPALPCDMGREAAGVVVARGPDATEFAVGDTVCVARLAAGGCYAERVAASATEVLPPPKGWSFEELAAFPNTFATAWYVLRELGRVRPGASVLIQAAAGGVGSAAVELARSMGCSPVLGTAGGPEKCAWVEETLGADACIDYRAGDFREAVRAHTDGRGVDLVLESVGGEVLERSLEVLAPLGMLVTLGFSSIDADYAERLPRLHPLTLFHRSIAVAGLNVANLDYPARREVWAELVAHVETHGLRPRIGASFPLDQAPEAHRLLEGRASRGKVLLLP